VAAEGHAHGGQQLVGVDGLAAGTEPGNNEAESTGTGTPSSIAAFTVQRPSPESETRPAMPSSFGLLFSAPAVRSSSHEEITEPRRQTSVTLAMSRSYW